jgi:hypothetical protein
MLNNLTNFLSILSGRRFKKTLESSDVIAVGTKQSQTRGDYKPTAITYADLFEQLNSTISGGGSGFDGLYENRVAIIDPINGDDVAAEFGRVDIPFKAYAGGGGNSTSPPEERVLSKINNWELENGVLTQYRRALVVLRPGVYDSENLALRNYVDLYCMPGVVFKGTAKIYTSYGVGRDGALEARVLGHAIYDDTDEPLSEKVIFITVTGDNVDLHIEMDRINSMTNPITVLGNNGNFTFVCNSVDTKSLTSNCGITVRGYGGTANFTIREYIKAYHRTWNFRLGAKSVVVNCPESYLIEGNFYGANFKMVMQADQWLSTGSIKFNGDLISTDPVNWGSIAATLNTNNGNGPIEINGNIYGGINRAVYIGSNGGNPTVKINGNVSSDELPIQLTVGTTIFKNSSLLNTNVENATTPVAAISGSAKAYFQDCLLYNGADITSGVDITSLSAQVYFYNCLHSGIGTNGWFIFASNVGTTVQIHNTRSNRDLNPNVSDVLTPTGFIFDANLITPNFI